MHMMMMLMLMMVMMMTMATITTTTTPTTTIDHFYATILLYIWGREGVAHWMRAFKQTTKKIGHLAKGAHTSIMCARAHFLLTCSGPKIFRLSHIHSLHPTKEFFGIAEKVIQRDDFREVLILAILNLYQWTVNLHEQPQKIEFKLVEHVDH